MPLLRHKARLLFSSQEPSSQYHNVTLAGAVNVEDPVVPLRIKLQVPLTGNSQCVQYFGSLPDHSWVAVKNISILTAKDIDSQIRTINRTSVFKDVPDERLYKWQIARAPDQWISALEEDEGFSRFKSLLAPLSQAAEAHDHPPPGKRLKSTISPSTSLNNPVHNVTVREIFIRNILWARDILEQLLLSNDGPTQTDMDGIGYELLSAIRSSGDSGKLTLAELQKFRLVSLVEKISECRGEVFLRRRRPISSSDPCMRDLAVRTLYGWQELQLKDVIDSPRQKNLYEAERHQKTTLQKEVYRLCKEVLTLRTGTEEGDLAKEVEMLSKQLRNRKAEMCAREKQHQSEICRLQDLLNDEVKNGTLRHEADKLEEERRENANLRKSIQDQLRAQLRELDAADADAALDAKVRDLVEASVKLG